MRYVIIALLISAYLMPVHGQKYFTKDGKITFLSSAPMEEIKATNERATSVFDVESGAMEWAVLINAFKFKKALMEEHFNENYMESTKFPKGTFKGLIENIDAITFDKDGTYETQVNGELEIHGVTQSISPAIKFVVEGGEITGTCTFKILVADYEIEIPKVVRENIAKEVEITIVADYSLLN